jgi:hypothetical protein
MSEQKIPAWVTRLVIGIFISFINGNNSKFPFHPSSNVIISAFLGKE